MEPSDEQDKMSKKAENLNKRRQQRRQRLLEETARGKETRLAKRREAWKLGQPKQKVSKKGIRDFTGNRKQQRKVSKNGKLG